MPGRQAKVVRNPLVRSGEGRADRGLAVVLAAGLDRALEERPAARRQAAGDEGDEDREFKWNNYLGRYHSRHLDLMDVLALYTPRANAPLDELAKLCGFPGKLGMDGSQVWPAYREGHRVLPVTGSLGAFCVPVGTYPHSSVP